VAYKQEPPFAVQVELTEGCNLRCSFCGINGIRGKERTYKFMKPHTAEAIAKQIADARWNPRIEFAMHGEPTMHPDAPGIVAIFRRYLPKVSMLMLSNGGGLQGSRGLELIDRLFAAGLNTLGLDEYQNVSLVPKIMEAVGSSLKPLGFEVLRYPDQPEGNPHARQSPRVRRLVHIRPIDVQTTGTHSTLNNHAGSGAPPNAKGQGKPCAKPFRELSFRWDGTAAICCNDWRGELALGSIHKEGLLGIWHSKVADEARKRLIIGQRDFGPCEGCDAVSYRVGLLPDKLGSVTLPKPTAKGRAILDEAAKRNPLTKPVKREWE